MVAAQKASSSVPGSAALTKGGLPRGFGNWSPAARSDWLCGPECAAAVEAKRLQTSKVESEKTRARKDLGRIAYLAASPALHYCYPFPPPSENTPMRPADRMLDEQHEADVLWPAIYLQGGRERLDKDGRPVVDALGRGFVDGGATYDVVCHQTEQIRQRMEMEHANESAPVSAIAEVCERGIHWARKNLPTEDVEVLKRQLGAYLEGRSVSILTLSFEPKERKKKTPM